MKHYGVVYVITNNINDMLYVGQTTQSLEERFRQHCKASNVGTMRICRAIQKYGKEHFQIRLLQAGSSPEELGRLEVKWSDLLNTMSPNGYNLQVGDAGSRKHNEESLVKIREARARQVFSSETREKFSKRSQGEGSPNAKLTEDQVRQIREEYKFRKVTHKMLAEKYGVHHGHIAAVLKRRVWKHI
jgi:group I intron endonuclease